MAKAIFEDQLPGGQDLPNGRRIVEGEMPARFQYAHTTLRSFGTPRRVSLYDSTVHDKYSVNAKSGHLKQSDEGESGLIGYADIYREPERVTVNHRRDGKHDILFTKDTNVGWMNSEESHRGGGVGRQLFDYVVNTTPKNSWVDLGRVMDDNLGAMWEKHQAEKKQPYVHGKVWYTRRNKAE
jgi:hypothetical protein